MKETFKLLVVDLLPLGHFAPEKRKQKVSPGRQSLSSSIRIELDISALLPPNLGTNCSTIVTLRPNGLVLVTKFVAKSVAVIDTMELDKEVSMRRHQHTSRESEVVMDARARLALRVRKISDEGRKLVAASIARIARKLGHNARGDIERG